MTIRTRLTFWYAGILTASLLVIGFGTYEEISEQLQRGHRHDPQARALGEAGEMVLQVGLPAVLCGLLGGWWLTRRLDESFHRIREFTLHASHELKTPLTVLRGETETALRDENISAPERERATSQLEELRRLTQIVDGLTLLAKADAGLVALTLEPLRLDELVRDCFADLQILAEPQQIKVELEACAEISVRGDRHRLRQLLLNLADNAVKYNQPQGRVTMSLRRAENIAEFKITNTGAGIPPEMLPRVFDRFFRGDSAHGSAVEGCGLGLSIAQWVVSAHHGKIQIVSEPTQPTIVTVQLPTA